MTGAYRKKMEELEEYKKEEARREYLEGPPPPPSLLLQHPRPQQALLEPSWEGETHTVALKALKDGTSHFNNHPVIAPLAV